jgi:hypothetical protein
MIRESDQTAARSPKRRVHPVPRILRPSLTRTPMHFGAARTTPDYSTAHATRARRHQRQGDQREPDNQAPELRALRARRRDAGPVILRRALRSLWDRPADEVRNRSDHKTEDSTNDRRRHPKLENRKPRCRRVGAESEQEPDGTSDHARRNHSDHSPPQELGAKTRRQLVDAATTGRSRLRHVHLALSVCSTHTLSIQSCRLEALVATGFIFPPVRHGLTSVTL